MKVEAGEGTTMQVLISSREGPNFALRRFTIKPGGFVPRHTNTVEHEQYVLRGQAAITIGAAKHEVQAGDAVLIPEGEIHSYQNTGNEPFEFLCIVPNKADQMTLVDGSA
jgi:quercetin dioxygenase-like cupin family protein